MRRFALLLILVGLSAQPAFAEDMHVQPLTRALCDQTGMVWMTMQMSVLGMTLPASP